MPKSTALAIIKGNNDLIDIDFLMQFPQKAANVVGPLLKKCDLPTYQHFLYMMYHYTMDSERKLHYAASKSDNKELRDYFEHMAKEERGHYIIAQKDYEEFGLTIDDKSTPKSVADFDKFWYTLGNQDCNEFIGALFVFESVADLVGAEIVGLIQRLKLTKRQSRWLTVHAEADHDHGDEAKEMCLKYGPNNPDALVAAAGKATEMWCEVFRQALTPQ